MEARAGLFGILGLLLALFLGACNRNAALQIVGILEWDRIELTAEAHEPIVEIWAQEGANLQAGQPILRLDPRQIQAQYDEAAAVQRQAAARLAELKRGPRAERIEQARAQRRGADSVAATADIEFARVRALFHQQLTSQEALDRARTERDRAHAERDRIHAELEELLSGATREEIQQAEAVLAQAEARLEVLELTLERLTLRAPRAGRLDILPYKLGERPPAGAVVAVMLAGEAPYARVYVPEPLWAGVTLGTRAKVFVDGVPRPFDGQVRMISQEAVFTPFYSLTARDRSRLSYLAEVLLEGSEGAAALPSGVPLQVEFLATAGSRPW